MKSALALAVVMVLFAAPAFAGDGNVSQGTLSSLGLGDMQVVSDAEGMQVRGMSSFAFASSFSFVSGFMSYDYEDGNAAYSGFLPFSAVDRSLNWEDRSGNSHAYAESGIEVVTPFKLTFDLPGSEVFKGIADFAFGGFARAKNP